MSLCRVRTLDFVTKTTGVLILSFWLLAPFSGQAAQAHEHARIPCSSIVPNFMALASSCSQWISTIAADSRS